MTFHIGQPVTSHKPTKRYSTVGWVPPMDEYIGAIQTIKSVSLSVTDGETIYRLNKSPWNYRESWLISLGQEEEPPTISEMVMLGGKRL